MAKPRNRGMRERSARSTKALAALSLYRRKSDLLGVAELAMVLEVRPNVVSMRMLRGNLPPPDFKLRATSCWYGATIEKWLVAGKL